jgi:hypothetical protein
MKKTPVQRRNENSLALENFIGERSNQTIDLCKYDLSTSKNSDIFVNNLQFAH